jgi:hypothetical protein
MARKQSPTVKKQVYLFDYKYGSLGVITTNVNRARAYIKERSHMYPDAKYVGIDSRTTKEQSESFTLGINVPDDWKPERTTHKPQMSGETKEVLCRIERFLQDVVMYRQEERSTYTVEELATVRGGALLDFGTTATELREAIADIYENVYDDSYPES